MTPIAGTEPPLEAVLRLTPLIQQYADESESARTLAQPVVDAVVEAGLFRQLSGRNARLSHGSGSDRDTP